MTASGSGSPPPPSRPSRCSPSAATSPRPPEPAGPAVTPPAAPAHNPQEPTVTTRIRAQRTRKKPAATAKPTPGPIPAPRPDLPLRERGPFITDIQIRAAYAASLAGVTYTRITGWLRQPDGTARYTFPSGAALTYNPAAPTPLTAWTPCDNGTRHPHLITTPADLHQARTDAAACTSHHHTPAVRTLADALTHSDTTSDDTQAVDVTDLRAAHDDLKEHPHG